MSERTNLMAEIERKREEIKQLLHAGSTRLKEQWDELELKWNDFAERAQLRETSGEVEEALRSLGAELLKGYDRLRAAMRRQEGVDTFPNELRPKVEQLAHELWVKRGQPSGSPDVDWFEAERQVLGHEHGAEAHSV